MAIGLKTNFYSFYGSFFLEKGKSHLADLNPLPKRSRKTGHANVSIENGTSNEDSMPQWNLTTSVVYFSVFITM